MGVLGWNKLKSKNAKLKMKMKMNNGPWKWRSDGGRECPQSKVQSRTRGKVPKGAVTPTAGLSGQSKIRRRAVAMVGRAWRKFGATRLGGDCSGISTCFHLFQVASAVFRIKYFSGVSAVGWPGAGRKARKTA